MRALLTKTAKDIENDLWTVFDKYYPKLTATAGRAEKQTKMVEEMSRYVYDLFLDYKSEMRRMAGEPIVDAKTINQVMLIIDELIKQDPNTVTKEYNEGYIKALQDLYFRIKKSIKDG